MQLSLALASLRRHPTRTTLAILGVAVASAMLLNMIMLAGGMRQSFQKLLLSKGYELRISPKGTLPFDTDALILNAGEITAKLKTNPAITEISPVLGSTVHFLKQDSVVTASFALGSVPESQGDYELSSGRYPVSDNEIVINDNLAQATRLRIGDTVSIAAGYNPQVHTFTAKRQMAVTGTAHFLYLPSDQRATAMQLPALQTLAAHEGQVSLFMLKLQKGANAEHVRRWVEENVPRVTSISIATALAQVEERLSYFRQLSYILGAVSLLVGFLLVTTLVTVSVNERIGEISVMRAIGISTAHVVQQIVAESLGISLSGAVIGLGLGIVVSEYLDNILSAFPGLPASIRFFVFNPGDAAGALGMLVISGAVAGIYPAWRASTLGIAKTLRQEAIA